MSTTTSRKRFVVYLNSIKGVNVRQSIFCFRILLIWSLVLSICFIIYTSYFLFHHYSTYLCSSVSCYNGFVLLPYLSAFLGRRVLRVGKFDIHGFFSLIPGNRLGFSFTALRTFETISCYVELKNSLYLCYGNYLRKHSTSIRNVVSNYCKALGLWRHRGNTFYWRHSSWSVVITICPFHRRACAFDQSLLRVRRKDRYFASF